MSGDPPRDPAAVAAVHARLLARWRVAMDLVGPGPLEPHFVDAAGAVAGLQARGRWADLGSGAGFPGVALAATWPDAEVLLVESRQKRASFLETVVAETGLKNARIHRGRAEALPASSFDGLIARAFKPPAETLALAARLLAPGGVAVVLTGDAPLEAQPGWAVVEQARYPVIDGWRRRVVLRRG